MQVRVSVATTRGPVRILKLTRENPSVRSAICIAGSFSALPVSNAYDGFVRAPTGVIEQMTGHPVYRADVSGPIDAGDSWQFGLYLAHLLDREGLLAGDGDGIADLDLLVTGLLDRDLRVGAVAHIAGKLAQAGTPRGRKAIFLFPAGGEPPPDIPPADRTGWHCVPAATINDALNEILGPEAAAALLSPQTTRHAAPEGHSPEHPAEHRTQGRLPSGLPLAFAGLLAIGSTALAVAGGIFLYGPGSPPDIRDAEALSLEITPRDSSGQCGPPVKIPPTQKIFSGRACSARMTTGSAGEYLLRMAITGDFLSYTDPRRYRRQLHDSAVAGYRLVLEMNFPYWVRETMQLEIKASRLGLDGQPRAVSERSLILHP